MHRGNTWKTILQTLDELGDTVFAETVDAQHYVPQHRERIFIVGFRRDLYGDEPAFGKSLWASPFGWPRFYPPILPFYAG